jgi:hypothetical protein
MKKILIILLAASIQLSCEKEADYNAGFEPANQYSHSFVKIINVYPFAQPAFTGQTSAAFRFSYNDALLSAIPTAVGGAFPAAPEYFAVTRGDTERRLGVSLALGTPPATTTDQFLFEHEPPLFKLTKYYSMFLCDSLNKTSRFFVVEDDIQIPQNDTAYRVRFVNTIPNPPGATPSIDVYANTVDSLIFTGIKFKQATPFIELKRAASASSNTFRIKWTGTNTVIGTISLTLANKMSATLVAKGFVGATGLRAPGLVSYRNK